MKYGKWLAWCWWVLHLCGAANAAQIYPDHDAGYAVTLNGNWQFKYLPGLEAGADAGFTAPAFDVRRWSSIAVPANWELQGHAEPRYGDQLEDGLGLYRRTFDTPSHWQGRRTYLRFDGVAFGYQVWLNGKQVGASGASAFNRHTFDVTDFVLASNNVLAVRVTTKPLGYEFDLNDDWSLSGIYRDVTLISLPATHVQDINTRTVIRGDSAQLELDVALSAPGASVEAQLFDPQGRRVLRQTLKPGRPPALEPALGPAAPAQRPVQADDGRHRAPAHAGLHAGLHASLHIARARLWTAETPALYRLVLRVTQQGKTLQTVEQRIGLRQVRVDGKLLLVNGQPVKLRGVNHHDLDPVTGRAVTESQMRQDLALLKRGNVNYVRTSHYPPHPRLLDLCDELGFYVMDEVAIGHGEKNLDNPDYRANILARARATVARDKHHASIIIWSIGNENPINAFELEAGQLVKQLDPTRPITIPKIGSYFARNYQQLPPHIDLYAPHYPSNATLSGYAEKLTRPTILTEYAHALGLATDRLQDQWAILQANPVFAGGSVWHFHDQGLLRRSATPVDAAQPTQYAWRDAYHYYDTHGLDGADGLVYADRTPQVDYWQLRKVYAPVQFIEREAQVASGAQQVTVTLENRHDFRSLQGITLHWTLQQNGKTVQQGQQPLSAPARGRQTATIAVQIPAPPLAYTDVLTLQLRAVDEQGLQINERALRLLRPQARTFDWTTATAAPAAAPVLEDNASDITVTTPQWRLTVQRASGALQIHDRYGRVLVDGIHPHSGRQLTMAEALGAQKSGTWNTSILERLQQPLVKAAQQEGRVTLSVHGTYRLPPPVAADLPRTGATALPDDLVPTGASAAAATPDQGLTGGYELEIDSRGALTVSYTYRPLNSGAIVSEAGLSVVAPTGASELRWIGQGPYAGYPGKDQLNEFGIYHLGRDDLRFQGNRRQTELTVLTDAGGAGFALATPAADVAVERHGARTLLSHNAVIGGLGNKGTQPETIVALDAGANISGRFVVLPLGGAWPRALQDWLGAPGAAAEVVQPFFHSYDQ